MKTCPNCGAEMEPTPSGMLTCPKGDSRLYSAYQPLKQPAWAVEFGPDGLPTALHLIQCDAPRATEVFDRGEDRRWFRIEGHEQRRFNLARGQCRNGREVVAIWQGQRRTFVPA